MRVVIQRSSGTEVWIHGAKFSAAGAGLLVLFGTKAGDTEALCAVLAEKVANLRIFEDDQDKMNLSALEVHGEIMVVSQFTLYADARKGRRPSFNGAMEPVEAERLYEVFVTRLRQTGLTVATGQFGAKMDVKFCNHGPVTIILDHDLPQPE